MAALTCDICGGQLIMDASGEFAVCESCGMKHTKDRMRAKAQEITGTVKIDDKDQVAEQVNNWEKMAMAAFDNSNYEEAYTYYCKIVEKRVNYWMATYRKGMCLGWQSTLGNIRANEVLGSVVDATKLLFNDETQTDQLKADGTMIMALEVYNWIQAVSNLVVNQANEYAGELVSAAREFYSRECLISELTKFNLGMLNEFTYENSGDKEGFVNLANAMMNSGRTTMGNMSSQFRIKTGSKYNSFWQMYEDVFEDVSPDYKTNSSRTELSSAINTLSSNLNTWKQNWTRKKEAEAKAEKEAKIKKFWEENPTVYADYEAKVSAEKEANDEKSRASSELSSAENKLRPITSEYTEYERKICSLQDEIDKLGKKIFGKKKAQEEITVKEAEIRTLKQKLSELEPKKKEAENLVDMLKKNSSEAGKKYQIAHNNVTKILHDNGLE